MRAVEESVRGHAVAPYWLPRQHTTPNPPLQPVQCQHQQPVLDKSCPRSPCTALSLALPGTGSPPSSLSASSSTSMRTASQRSAPRWISDSTRPVVPTATWQALREGSRAQAGASRRGYTVRGSDQPGCSLCWQWLVGTHTAVNPRSAARQRASCNPSGHGLLKQRLVFVRLSPAGMRAGAHLRSCFSSSSTGSPPMKEPQASPGGGSAAATSATASLACSAISLVGASTSTCRKGGTTGGATWPGWRTGTPPALQAWAARPTAASTPHPVPPNCALPCTQQHEKSKLGFTNGGDQCNGACMRSARRSTSPAPVGPRC